MRIMALAGLLDPDPNGGVCGSWIQIRIVIL